MLYTGQAFGPLLRVAEIAADTWVAVEAAVVAGIAVEGPSDAETLSVAVVMKRSADPRIVDSQDFAAADPSDDVAVVSAAVAAETKVVEELVVTHAFVVDLDLDLDSDFGQVAQIADYYSWEKFVECLQLRDLFLAIQCSNLVEFEFAVPVVAVAVAAVHWFESSR